MTVSDPHRTELNELRDMISDLAGDVREGMATIGGKIDTLEARKTLEHRTIHDHIDGLRDTDLRLVESDSSIVDRVKTLERRFDRLFWLGLGVGLGAGSASGGVAAFIVTAIGG